MKLGFIGTGKIASSVITGICKSSIKFNKIFISSRNNKISKQKCIMEGIENIDLKDIKIKYKKYLENKYFGEGLTIINDNLIQLTWKNKIISLV